MNRHSSAAHFCRGLDGSSTKKFRFIYFFAYLINIIHQILAYVDDANLIGDDIRIIERNADVLLNPCKEQ